jgi:hypothetical protein
VIIKGVYEMKFLYFLLLIFVTVGFFGTFTRQDQISSPFNTANSQVEIELPKFEVIDVDNDYYKVEIKSRDLESSMILHKDGGITPEIVDSFSTNYCGKKALVLILRSEIKSAASYGNFYTNLVIEKTTNKLLEELVTGEIKDKQNDSVISNDHQDMLARLRAGINDKTVCKKN